MSTKDEKTLYQLEIDVKTQGRQIDEIKKVQSDFSKSLYGKMDTLNKDMHTMALASQATAISSQRWMLTILLGFVAQTATGVLIFIMNKGGV